MAPKKRKVKTDPKVAHDDNFKSMFKSGDEAFSSVITSKKGRFRKAEESIESTDNEEDRNITVKKIKVIKTFSNITFFMFFTFFTN